VSRSQTQTNVVFRVLLADEHRQAATQPADTPIAA
jgi:hypothetical protein